MDRLTKRDEYGNADVIGIWTADVIGNLEFDEVNAMTKAINCLAAYEETGLTPEEINKLNNFEQSQCAKLLTEVAKLKAERDAAVDLIPVCCETCIHGIGPEECDIEVCYWQWRGVEVQHEQA